MEALNNTHPIIVIKFQLKELAADIRRLKASRREAARSQDYSLLGTIQYNIIERKFSYRSNHIAYCEVRGRTYEQIERNPSTEPNRYHIDSIKKTLLKKIEEFNQNG